SGVYFNLVIGTFSQNTESPTNPVRFTILGEQTPIVAQHMIQAALFGLLEKQVNEWQAEVVDEQPKFLS
ncbi:hypothetical protein F4T75_11370, partial [Acinetobacter baumannii]|nr:hypothetical protein [Acinetobacter baumannii]MQY93853.1 hypothetical protein [Acinetobacter baumannii]MQZ16292.1 hypothetical protein [Acinetobacter baumannii]MQZ35071.1 hypothetical protein [Acinetobacter baumannii]MQZ50120.1 hypothetical protein [Acinetobacter baumannii]